MRAKLYAGFGVALLLTAVLGVMMITQIGSVNAISHTLSASDFPSVVQIGDAEAALNDYVSSTYEGIIETNPSDRAVQEQSAAQDAQTIDTILSNYAKLAGPGQDTTDYHEVQAQWAAFTSANGPLLSRTVSQGPATQALVLKLDNQTVTPLQTLLASWSAVNQKTAAADTQTSAATYSSARTLGIALLVLALVIGSGIAFQVSRSITRPLVQITRAAKRIAEGDVDVEVEARGDDEIGQMASAFRGSVEYLRAMVRAAREIAAGNLSVDVQPKSEQDALGHAFAEMREKIAGMVSQIRQTSASVSSASQQMAATSQETGRATGEIAHAVGDVAQGAERQVQMVEAARSAAEEVARAVSESAESASQAAEVAHQTSKVAHDGVSAAAHANEAMRSVTDSSQAVNETIRELAVKSDQIGAIVATITAIAEQTNLLALNAAIEAARAGEQGRGFAVVAEEVRKLAEESQHAAQEITGLIGAIQSETTKAVRVVEDGAKRTQDGVVVVGRTREAFEQIESSVDDMTARIEQIAAASQQIAASAASMQQSIGEVAAVAEQSSASTEQVSASTEQTSASAQEIAANAQELSGNAEELNRLVAQFKTAA